MLLFRSFISLLTMLPLLAFAEPSEEQKRELQADQDAFQKMLKQVDPNALHAALHDFSPKNFKHGMFPEDRSAVEAIHADAPDVARGILRVAQLNKRQVAANGTVPTSPSTPPVPSTAVTSSTPKSTASTSASISSVTSSTLAPSSSNGPVTSTAVASNSASAASEALVTAVTVVNGQTQGIETPSGTAGAGTKTGAQPGLQTSEAGTKKHFGRAMAVVLGAAVGVAFML